MEKQKHNRQVQLQSGADLDALIGVIGHSRIVMLGEATHGSHEFYTWRTAITKRLIKEKDFSIIAVEGDWPDCYRINRHVKGYDLQPADVFSLLAEFNRWPTWMWANFEIAAFCEWLSRHNEVSSRKVGFYGLDVYSLWESMEAIVAYLKENDPPAVAVAEKALKCFSGAGRNEQQYAVQSFTSSCRNAVVKLLSEIRARTPVYEHDPEEALNMLQNAHVAVEAEKYYRNMVSFDDQTWNIRDSHMLDTLDRLLHFYGHDSKAVVWEHNTHIGDARYTSMASQGLHNLGQLARQKYGQENVSLVGFASYAGTVMAGSAWGAPMQQMQLPEARPGSIEEFLHHQDASDRYMIFSQHDPAFSKVWPHRAVGVVYHPHDERGNYVPSVLSQRYDALVYLDLTSALHPIHLAADKSQVPSTYPFEY